MNFKTVKFTLSADVADSGTFTVGYPSGFDDGNFETATGHYISMNGTKLFQPNDIGLSFGDTSVTVTNRTGGVLAKDSVGYLTLFTKGVDTAISGKTKFKKQVRGKALAHARVFSPLRIDFGSPLTADADGICASQSGTAATAMSLNGALLGANNLMILDVPRNVVATWTGTAVLTVVGEDEYGQPMIESSGSGTSMTGVKAFKKIISVTPSANITSATVGTGVVLGLPIAVRNASNVLAELENDAHVGSPKVMGLVDFNVAIDVADLSTGSAAAPEFVAPFAFEIVKIRSTVRVAISTGGTITMDVRGGTAVAGLSITVANSATKGTSQTDTPTVGDASTLVAKGDRVQIVPQDAFTGGGAIDIVLTVRPLGLYSGTLVTALAANTKATATTADPRGTYSPATAPDGTTNYALHVLVAEPYDIGGEQYYTS